MWKYFEVFASIRNVNPMQRDFGDLQNLFAWDLNSIDSFMRPSWLLIRKKCFHLLISALLENALNLFHFFFSFWLAIVLCIQLQAIKKVKSTYAIKVKSDVDKIVPNTISIESATVIVKLITKFYNLEFTEMTNYSFE